MASAAPGVPVDGVGAPSASSAVVAKLKESYQAAVAQQRPWSEVLDRSTISKPDNLNDALGRIRKNLSYFKANYLTIMLIVIVLSMLSSPSSILYTSLLACVWIYLFMVRSEPLVLGGRSLNEREKFLGMVLISIVVIFGLTTVGSILMSGIVIGAVVISIHAALHVPDDLFLDQPESSGFLSFLGGGNSQAATIGV